MENDTPPGQSIVERVKIIFYNPLTSFDAFVALFKKFQANNDIVLSVACNPQDTGTGEDTEYSLNSLVDNIQRFNFDPSTFSRVFQRTPCLGQGRTPLVTQHVERIVIIDLNPSTAIFQQLLYQPGVVQSRPIVNETGDVIKDGAAVVTAYDFGMDLPSSSSSFRSIGDSIQCAEISTNIRHYRMMPGSGKTLLDMVVSLECIGKTESN